MLHPTCTYICLCVAATLGAMRWCVQLVLEKGYSSWLLENVAEPCSPHSLDAADYGLGSNRVRLVVSAPAAIKALKLERI